jgi:hypothetical protein
MYTSLRAVEQHLKRRAADLPIGVCDMSLDPAALRWSPAWLKGAARAAHSSLFLSPPCIPYYIVYCIYLYLRDTTYEFLIHPVKKVY